MWYIGCNIQHVLIICPWVPFFLASFRSLLQPHPEGHFFPYSNVIFVYRWQRTVLHLLLLTQLRRNDIWVAGRQRSSTLPATPKAERQRSSTRSAEPGPGADYEQQLVFETLSWAQLAILISGLLKGGWEAEVFNSPSHTESREAEVSNSLGRARARS